MQTNIIIFDGECNLCNGVVGWLLKSTTNSTFDFVPFQSKRGYDLLTALNFRTDQLETVIYLNEDGIHTHSDGFLKIMAELPRWRWTVSILQHTPKILRDTIYKTASRNRVKWFGSSISCSVVFKK